MKSYKKIKKFNEKLIKIHNKIVEEDNKIHTADCPNYIADTLDEISLMSLRCIFQCESVEEITEVVYISLNKILRRYVKVEVEDFLTVISFVGERIIEKITEAQNCNPTLMLYTLIEALSDIEVDNVD